MTVLDADWDNMGGRTIIRSDRNTPGAREGDTISHPLNGPLPAQLSHVPGVWNRSSWTTVAQGSFPGLMGAETLDITDDTLAGAYAATPV